MYERVSFLRLTQKIKEPLMIDKKNMTEEEKLLDDRIYEQKNFDCILVVKERTERVASRVSDFLKETDRFSSIC